MNVLVYENEEQIGIAAGNYMCGQVLAKPDSVLGLATGSTLEWMYSRLVDMYNNGEVDFSRVTTFNLDGYYLIAQSDEQSYHTFMNKNLFWHLSKKLPRRQKQIRTACSVPCVQNI